MADFAGEYEITYKMIDEANRVSENFRFSVIVIAPEESSTSGFSSGSSFSGDSSSSSSTSISSSTSEQSESTVESGDDSTASS